MTNIHTHTRLGHWVRNGQNLVNQLHLNLKILIKKIKVMSREHECSWVWRKTGIRGASAILKLFLFLVFISLDAPAVSASSVLTWASHGKTQPPMTHKVTSIPLPSQATRQTLNAPSSKSQRRTGIGSAHVISLQLAQLIICWQRALFYTTYRAVPMVSLRTGGDGYFTGKKGISY